MKRIFARRVLPLILILTVILLGVASCGGDTESPTKAVEASEICFTTFTTDAQLLLTNGKTRSDFERASDGRVILRSGMLYKVQPNTVEWMTAAYEDSKDLTIIEYVDPDDLTLSCSTVPENATDKLYYYCEDTNVTIDASGKVIFSEPSEKPVQIFVRTQQGVFASVVLVWDKPKEAIPMS